LRNIGDVKSDATEAPHLDTTDIPKSVDWKNSTTPIKN